MITWSDEDIHEDDNVDAVAAVSYRRNLLARQQAAEQDDEGPEQSD
jgi:hypothetical protein